MFSTNFKLFNEYFTIEISEMGAELQSIFHHKIGKELLWQGHQDYWPRKAPVLFPIVGKLKKNTYTYDQKTFELTQHGFARDSKFSILEKSEHSISYIFSSNESSLKIYPFKFDLIITYTINEDSLFFNYKIVNQDDKNMLCSIGGHPGFNCPLYENETIEDYELKFETKEEPIRFNLSDGLVTDSYQEKPIQNIQLSEELFKNDALIYTQLKSTYIDLSNNKNYTLRFTFNDMPYLAFWKKPNATFVCIEPWHGIADQIDTEGIFETKKAILTLKPKQEFETGYSIKVL